MTLDELKEQGHSKVRLPGWNQAAYLEVLEDGPWCKLWDIRAGIDTGQPTPVLYGVCNAVTTWEQASPQSGNDPVDDD